MKNRAGQRLLEPETEADNIIERYLRQVQLNPDARELKELQQRFAGVRVYDAHRVHKSGATVLFFSIFAPV